MPRFGWLVHTDDAPRGLGGPPVLSSAEHLRVLGFADLGAAGAAEDGVFRALRGRWTQAILRPAIRSRPDPSSAPAAAKALHSVQAIASSLRSGMSTPLENTVRLSIPKAEEMLHGA